VPQTDPQIHDSEKQAFSLGSEPWLSACTYGWLVRMIGPSQKLSWIWGQYNLAWAR
jgi:hypothetical protein